MNSLRAASLADVVQDARSGFACGEEPENGVFQFRMNNINTDGSLDFTRKRRVPERSRNIDAFLVEPGDVLFNATNSPDLVGKTAYFAGLDEPAVFSNHFLRLRPKRDRLDGRYLARWLTLQYQRGVFKGMCRQWVNQATVNREALLSLRVPIPPISEQRRIAEVLDRAEALRAKRRSALAQLDTLTQAIFLDMFGDPAANAKDWPLRPIGDLASKFSDGPFGSNLKSEHYVEEGIRVVRLQNIGLGEFVDRDKAFISEEHFAQLKKHECHPGDVLVATLGDPNLRACVQPSWLPVALNKADCVQLRPDPKVADATFVSALLNCPSTEKMARKLMLGQTRVRISMGRLRELKVPVPPLSLQQDFAKANACVDDMRDRFRRSLLLIDDLFSTLQDRAFHGSL